MPIGNILTAEKLEFKETGEGQLTIQIGLL